MTRRALFRESTTGALDDGAGGVVVSVPDPSGEPDGKVIETSSGSLVYGTVTSVSGNAGTATKLATARNIDGEAFDGTADITVIAPGTHAATSKATPVDADEVPLVDSAAANVLAKLTWANLKSTLKTYFDTLYAPIGGGGGGASIGESSLVYRYTVSGSDKASIDTGVDTPDAGSNDWTNGDLLEVWFMGRTDDAAGTSLVTVTLNNDGGGNYDRQQVSGSGTTAAAAQVLASAGWGLQAHGSGGTAAYAGAFRLTITDYAGTTFNKMGELTDPVLDTTGANMSLRLSAIGWRSTAAINRLAISASAGQKLKVGSQLLIYKRLAS